MHDHDAFAAEWLAAWNARDLERILSHYAEGVSFLSPVAERMTGGGRIEGKEALRAYWTQALARAPDLAFALEAVYRGAGAMTIAYRNHLGGRVAESFVFGEDGKVILSAACYLR